MRDDRSFVRGWGSSSLAGNAWSVAVVTAAALAAAVPWCVGIAVIVS